MPKIALDNKRANNLLLNEVKTKLFDTSIYTPRLSLFIIAILIMLTASAFSGIAFVLNNTFFYIAGTIFWLLWFALLFIIAIPETDQRLQNHIHGLKKSAITIIVLLIFLGMVELTAISGVGFDTLGISERQDSLSDVLNSLNATFNYNDATALCHQAVENFLDGKNPYAESNIVSAMLQFNVPINKLTPLRLGILSDVYPGRVGISPELSCRMFFNSCCLYDNRNR